MTLRLKSCAIALLLAGPFACGKSETPESSSTHWETCESPDDCDDIPRAVACASGYCIDENGERFEEGDRDPSCESYADCDEDEVCEEGRCRATDGNCGNDVVEPGEQCDGVALNNQTCMSLSMGQNDGVLACGADCKFVVAGCNQRPGENCGDGVVTASEQCDGTDLDGETCLTLSLGRNDGVLGCDADCNFLITGCNQAPAPGCGDGRVAGDEQCDGGDLDGETCMTLSQGQNDGNLSCGVDCNFVVAGCNVQPGHCGDGVVNTSREECDGTDLGAETCMSLTAGINDGILACDAECLYMTSECNQEPGYNCGDGRVTGSERCDGTNLDGETCLTVSGGSNDGVLACGSDCQFVVVDCNQEVPHDCGDGVITAGEQCDGTNLNGETCLTLSSGSNDGVLACDAECNFVITGCTEVPGN